MILSTDIIGWISREKRFDEKNMDFRIAGSVAGIYFFAGCDGDSGGGGSDTWSSITSLTKLGISHCSKSMET